MTPDQILARPARVLSQAQREAYFADGYLLVERLIDGASVTALKGMTDSFVEKARGMTRSDGDLDLDPAHSADRPMVRRLIDPDRLDPVYWAFATGIIADVAADLIGPDVTFNHSKLNFKWRAGKDEVKWHQDVCYYPHTNHNVLAIGCYLDDVTEADGPLMVIPGSHKGPIFEHFDAKGFWTGSVRDRDLPKTAIESAVALTGPKGSITVHHCRAVHGSKSTSRADGRPLLINAYAAADAFLYISPQSYTSPHYRAVIRGEPARFAHLDAEPCPIPPDWSAGYSTIYDLQGAAAGAPAPRDVGPRPVPRRAEP
jgi:ectoine hydroxylase